MTGVSRMIEPGSVGTKLIHGLWVDRWDDQNARGDEMPDIEVVKAWVEALRSGNYKQTKQVLASVNLGTEETAYCCLGVLCEVAVQKKVTNRWRSSTNTISFGPALPEGGKHPDEEQYAVLPVDVMEWAGVRASTVLLSRVKQVGEGVHGELYDMTEVYATELNDAVKMTFAQIADIAEYHFFGDAGVNGWADEQNKKEKA